MASKHHQTWASIRHRGQSIGPELGALVVCGGGRGCDGCCGYGVGGVGVFEQRAKLQKAALALGSDDRISCSACVSADLGPAIESV
jgi:hypothetical protein